MDWATSQPSMARRLAKACGSVHGLISIGFDGTLGHAWTRVFLRGSSLGFTRQARHHPLLTLFINLSLATPRFLNPKLKF